MAYLSATLRSRINQLAHTKAILFEIAFKKKLTEEITKQIEDKKSLREIDEFLDATLENTSL